MKEYYVSFQNLNFKQLLMKKIGTFILAWVVIVLCNSWFIPILYFCIGFSYLNAIAGDEKYTTLWFDDFQKYIPYNLDTQVVAFSLVLITIASLPGAPFLFKKWSSDKEQYDHQRRIKEIELRLQLLKLQK